MNELRSCRVLDHLQAKVPRHGAWNMAVDEVLLERAAHTGTCTLRFYAWSVPTLSLGYFQRAAERAQHAPSSGCPLVRRMSGGGAILHDQELTYSLALPEKHPLAGDHRGLYLAVHQALINTLAEWQVRAELVCGAATEGGTVQPFLCFLRRTEGDVLIDGMKIAGSAQRRRARAVLQHGSVLLARSPAAPELPGVEEITGRRISAAELSFAWASRLQRTLGVSFRPGTLGEEEQAAASGLVSERYANAAWTGKR